MNENHPVRQALQAQLDQRREAYRLHPDELTRYEVVRIERLIAQWAPEAVLA